MAIKDRIDERPSFSYSSLLDIVFLLLIFFVLQPFKEPENQLRAELPLDGCCDHDRPPPPKPLEIMIGYDRRQPDAAFFRVRRVGEIGRAIWGGQGASERIAKSLAILSGGDPATRVDIVPHRDVHFEHVMAALDACYQARLRRVRFFDEPEKR